MSKEAMKKMGDFVEKMLPKEFGFAILVFPFNNCGIGNYISNAERGQMIVALRETAHRLEQNQITDTPKDNIYGTEKK